MNEYNNNAVSDTAIKELLRDYFKPSGSVSAAPHCPGEEALADYLGNRLDAASREDLEQHLLECDACLEAVIIGGSLPEGAVRESATRVSLSAVRAVLARLGADELRVLPAFWKRFSAACSSLAASLREIIFFKEPDVVYVRGSKHISKNLVVIEKTFSAIRLEIEVEEINQRATNIKVKTRSPETGDRINGVRVNILSRSREIASFVTTGGEALFENIAFGEYTINVHQNGKRLGHVLLDVKES